MFGELSFWQMLMKGGVTVIILIGISVISWWIVIDKAIRFTRIRVKPREFMDKVSGLVEKKDFDSVITLCETTPGPLAAVVLEGVRNRKAGRAVLEDAMQRALNTEAQRMQGGLGILGSIGNITPFIGLFGTVLGIIRAFHDLSLSSGGGPAVVASGIAEALVATATGIFVAIPAVFFYNIYVRTIDSIETEAINAASELSGMLAD